MDVEIVRHWRMWQGLWDDIFLLALFLLLLFLQILTIHQLAEKVVNWGDNLFAIYDS